MLAKLCRTAGDSVWRQLIPLQSIYLQSKPCSTSLNNIPVVQYDEVKRLRDHPEKLLIDVREVQELQETGQIPTSINIPLNNVSRELSANAEQFQAKYGRPKPRENTELIFHCKSGKRSLQAAVAAKGLGYNNIKNYEGSWLDWAERESLPK